MSVDPDDVPHHSDRDSEEVREWSVVGMIVGNPAVQALAIMTIVSCAGWAIVPGGVPTSFAVTPPIGVPPWELLLAIYAHLSVAHLVGNAVIIAVAGGIVSVSTSATRFHVFYVITGVASSVAQVALSSQFDYPIAVVGASGSAFALVGYVLTSNPLSLAVVEWLDSRDVALVMLGGAIALTLYYSASGSALVSHFVGAMLGMAAGRFRLLNVQ